VVFVRVPDHGHLKTAFRPRYEGSRGSKEKTGWPD